MIQIKDVRKAIKVEKNANNYLKIKALHQKLAVTLMLYGSRGEYTGTLESALSCLKLAGYEIQQLEPQGDEQNEGVG